jgi:hypothetical protein
MVTMKSTEESSRANQIFGVIILFVVVAALSLPARADVGTVCLSGERECEFRQIYLYRAIRPGDDREIRTLLERGATNAGERLNTTGIVLRSTGGNVDVAMRIGRLLRSRKARAGLFLDDVCYSACVLVLMGAVDRYVFGRIGVHRPYFSDFGDNRSADDVSALYKRMRAAVNAYADEMNVNRSLIDVMFSIEPAAMRILSDAEVAFYGLDRKDPVYAEFEVMEGARIYMVSPTEYRRRQKLIETKCRPLLDAEQETECTSLIRLGLDRPTYLMRRAIFEHETTGIVDRSRRIECMQAILIQGQKKCP